MREEGPPVTGYVVAGGQSLRMGRDKALLPWGAATLLDHAISRLRPQCAEVRILCGKEPRYEDRGVPVDVDAWPDGGPLGGVYTGLLRLHSGPGGNQPALFLGVDLPWVRPRLLRRLEELWPGHDAVVPFSPDGPQPLCALYATSCLEAVRRRLAAGQRRMTGFWEDIDVRRVEAAELAGFGDLDRLFRNINTPEDYERARR